MTTIAYRDGVLAADTAMFDRDCYCGQMVKIVKNRAGVMGGAAGCVGDCLAFLEWIQNELAGETPNFKDESSEGILIHASGKVDWIGHSQKRFELTGPFHALGSGFQIAIGALHAGATADRSVEIAAAVDSSTRGPVVTLSHHPKGE